MIKVALTGATGLVGSRVVELLGNDFAFLPLRHMDMDITDKKSVEDALEALDFDVFLHLAAYTNVDGAEREKETAYAVNRDGTRNLMDAVSRKGKKFVYVSTDFVFDGNNPPYYEDASPKPISVYGDSKYEGEKQVRDRAMIVRISYPYRSSFEGKKDFVRTIKSLLEEKKELTMVNDSLMVPTFIDDIAKAFNHLLQHFSPEIFHIVGSKAYSPFEAGQAIAQAFGLDGTLIKPVTYDTYFAGKAKRPLKSDIRSNKNTFAPMKSLEEGLAVMVQQ